MSVVNIKTGAAYDVFIGRAGPLGDGYFGNPFRVSMYGREGCLQKFHENFAKRVNTDADFAQRVLDLRGKVLGCFCKPLACHGDVIEEWIATAYCEACATSRDVLDSRLKIVREPVRVAAAYATSVPSGGQGKPDEVLLLCAECAG